MLASVLASALAFALVTAFGGVGCGDAGEGAARGRAVSRSSTHGVVVSTVDEDPIALSEVQALVAASSLTPLEALRRLQSERLLIAEATRRGVKGPAIDLVSSRARVQALLQAEADAIQVPDQELRELYAKDERFRMPERRKSIHVLARLPSSATPAQKQAAKELATEALADLGSTEPTELIARYRGKRVRGVDMKAEIVPASDRNGALVEEYRKALFSTGSVGVVPQAVESSFGWHAIRVLEIDPAKEIPFEEVAAPLRAELLLKRRNARVEALLTELRQAYLPVVEEAAVAKLAWVTDP